jgi:hypothetical protein
MKKPLDDEMISPTLLRNRKTRRFLVVGPETTSSRDWGWNGSDEVLVDVIDKHLELRDSEYQTSQVLFCTCDPNVVYDLVTDGKCVSPNIRIDFGWGANKFETSDLEPVSLKVD